MSQENTINFIPENQRLNEACWRLSEVTYSTFEMAESMEQRLYDWEAAFERARARSDQVMSQLSLGIYHSNHGLPSQSGQDVDVALSSIEFTEDQESVRIKEERASEGIDMLPEHQGPASYEGAHTSKEIDSHRQRLKNDSDYIEPPPTLSPSLSSHISSVQPSQSTHISQLQSQSFDSESFQPMSPNDSHETRGANKNGNQAANDSKKYRIDSSPNIATESPPQNPSSTHQDHHRNHDHFPD